MQSRKPLTTRQWGAIWRQRARDHASDLALRSLREAIKAGYRPDQPRVPAGNPAGGQWTGGGGAVANAPILVGGRDRTPPGTTIVNGRLLRTTPAQQTRLAISHIEMEAALRAVARVDPRWRPRPQLTETVEGQIAANSAIAVEARMHLNVIARAKIGPGPFAKESIPAPAATRRLSSAEQRRIDEIGRQFGCHRCGDKNPKTPSGRFVGDHQIPWALGKSSLILPHCLTCSTAQGGMVRGITRRGE